MPNGAASVVADPSPPVQDAQRAVGAAESAFADGRRRWARILFYMQAAIAILLYLTWVGRHSIVAAAIMAFIVFVLLTGLQLLAGLFTASEKRRLVDARATLATARQQEVEHNLASLQRGPYHWVRRGADYLAVFTDAGFLYYLGAASGDRHWMLDARRAVKEVRVTNRTHTQTTSTSTTKHGRRLVFAATDRVAMVGRGRSTTSTTINTATTTQHILEIQVQSGPGAQPSWIALPFGSDGREAENWRLLVEQLRF